MLINYLLLKQQISIFKSSMMILINYLQNLLTFDFFLIRNFQWLFYVDLDKLLISNETHLYAMLTTNLLSSYSKV